MRLEGLQAALVDLDGTLVDTAGDFVAAWCAMLDDLGLPPVDRPLVERLIGKGPDHIVGQSLEAAGCADPSPETLERARLFASITWVNGKQSAIYPGVEEGLRALASHACNRVRPNKLAPSPSPCARRLDAISPWSSATSTAGSSRSVRILQLRTVGASPGRAW